MRVSDSVVPEAPEWATAAAMPTAQALQAALEQIHPGNVLEVWLDEGEPSTSVPESAVAEGFSHLSSNPGPQGGVAVLIRKENS